ncbi:hypothetical protein GCM10010492_47440 [Saccharothrix mutabilis subsp. mutabilis]|uniref:ESX-1 secretion-associated protein n=1 Tax=Saccharothrix mutabilis subsp. mutabilis TaxID=66855 RepID=A0ABN0U920_9PSEU
MAPPDVHLAPADVDAVGGELGVLSDEARRVTTGLFDRTAAAATANAGWASAPAATACGDRWKHRVSALVNGTAALASSVQRSARAYHAADQETAARLKDVLGNMAAR